MDAAKINAKIYAGRGKAAQRLGYEFCVFRPQSAANPLDWHVRNIKAAFNATDNAYKRPNLYGTNVWFADLNGNLTRSGDYLKRRGRSETYFIAEQQSLLPIVAVECNRIIRMMSAVTPVPVGSVAGSASAPTINALPYSGQCAATGAVTDLVGSALPVGTGNMPDGGIGWPCSILFAKGSIRSEVSLPTNADKNEGWMMLLPPSLPVVIRAGMVVIDDLGMKYKVNGAEQTSLGWQVKLVDEHI